MAVQLVGRFMVDGRRQTNAGSNAKQHTINLERIHKLGEKAIGDQAQMFERCQTPHQDNKFVPAHSSEDSILIRNGPFDAQSRSLQQFVTCGVAKRIVDKLETIKVKEQQPDTAGLPAACRERFGQLNMQ